MIAERLENVADGTRPPATTHIQGKSEMAHEPAKRNEPPDSHPARTAEGHGPAPEDAVGTPDEPAVDEEEFADADQELLEERAASNGRPEAEELELVEDDSGNSVEDEPSLDDRSRGERGPAG
jgi:hypothetical protein